MDKLKSKELFRLHNVPTPPYYVAKQSDLADLEDLHGSFGFPAIVKPRAEGSSIGISRAQNLAELAVGVRRALDLGHDALVERWVKGAEVQVGILGGRVLGAIEVEPKNRPFYDFVAKYTPGQTEYHLPPRLSPTRVRGVMNLAERAARALGVEGACRVDMIVTEGENEYVLEVNTLPGMTQTSLLPKIAAAAGYDFGALCEAIVDLAKLHVPRAARPPRTEADRTTRARRRSRWRSPRPVRCPRSPPARAERLRPSSRSHRPLGGLTTWADHPTLVIPSCLPTSAR